MGWPWDQFPEDLSTWKCCVEEYKKYKDEMEKIKQITIKGMNLGSTEWNDYRQILCNIFDITKRSQINDEQENK